MSNSGVRAARRRELAVCAAVAIGLVLLRSYIFTAYENIFDSDQAIVGLMAKHLSELRDFPLFFYGQNYMLGVQAWIAAPFFRLGGPTVAMLRLPLVILNVVVVLGVMAAFARRGVRPVFALAAVLPLAATSPATSAELLSCLGASIEPFAYLLALWKLRDRPVWFGILLCFGALHREFTMFALPAILIVHWLESRRIGWRSIAGASAGFAAVWIAIDLIKVYALGGAPLTSEAREIGSGLRLTPGAYWGALSDAVTRGIPTLLGAHAWQLGGFGIQSVTGAGATLVAVTLAVAAGVSAVRLVWHGRPSDPPLRFCLYLGIVAIETLLAYGLSGIHRPFDPTLRYLLFAMLLPVALFGAYFIVEPNPAMAAFVAILLAIAGAANATDSARLVREFATSPPPNEHRELADYLLAHRIKYGSAIYWDAYVVTFFARERVILASLDSVRIERYQTEVAQNQSNAVTIHRQPCADGGVVSEWCVSDPAANLREKRFQ